MGRPHGTVAWNELLSSDPDGARRFYETALGWTFEAFPLGDAPYWLIKAGDETVGGLGGLEAGDAPATESYWIAVIEVDDVDRRHAAAIAAGATSVRAPHDVPGIGRVATLRDPTGGLVSWMTSAAA